MSLMKEFSEAGVKGEAGVNEAGVNEAGVTEAGVNEAGVTEAGVNEAGVNGAGVNETGVDEAGVNGAGVNEAGVKEAGVTEAGVNETGPNRETWTSHLDFILSCVGYCVGLGNVWRFPFLCYKNGGGAFLLPYLVMVLVASLPMQMLELAVGQYHRSGILGIWTKFPAFKGIGYACLVMTSWSNLYYPVVVAWALWYLLHSFRSALPWSSCNNDWNTVNCLEVNNRSFSDCESINTSILEPFNSSSTLCSGELQANFSRLVPSEEEFWNRYTIKISTGIEEVGDLNWQMALTYLLLWVLCYFCIWKGIKWSGKVVYVTALLPYVLIVAILIRGATLPGSAQGVWYFLYPEVHRLADSQVWVDAASQVFYSSGVGYGVVVVLASYNKFNQNIFRSAITVVVVNSATSILAGFTIFCVLGFLAQTLHKSMEDVATSGPGLVFIAYPSALSQLPLSPLWAVLFFLMLVMVGFDSTFCTLETFYTSIIDEFPRVLRQRRELFIGVVSLISFLLGLCMMTEGGIFVFQLMEWYAGSRLSLLTVMFFECLLFGWLYGKEGFFDQIVEMTGSKPSKLVLFSWRFVVPFISVAVIVFSLVQYTPVTYDEITYPVWAEVLGWFLTLSSIIWIPIVMLTTFLQLKGGFGQRMGKIFCPIDDNHPTSENSPPTNKEELISML